MSMLGATDATRPVLRGKLLQVCLAAVIAVLVGAALHTGWLIGTRQESLQDASFSVLSFGLIVCGLGLVGALTLHNRLLMGAYHDLSLTTADLSRVAADLASANRAVEAVNAELRLQNGRLTEKEKALQSKNVLFDATLNNMSQGLCVFDHALRPVLYNRRFEQLFAAELARQSVSSRLSLRDLLPDLAAEMELYIVCNRAASFETERLNGRIFAIGQQPMEYGAWLATFEDVTDRHRTQARIIHMSRHDGLTNLPNRYAFRERIKEALKQAAADGAMASILYVDLDNFKSLNDSLGHPSGDALLCAVAERLARSVRDGEMVSRFGGDEFAILQPRIAGADDAERLAVRLLDALREPFLIDGEQVYATASIGVALSPRHGDDPDVLQKNADLALYAAKAAGKRTYRFFESVMHERLANRHSLERDLRHAMAAGEFHLHYQPIVHLGTKRITGVEALLRWTHPVHGSVSPSEFIPVAEDAGLIGELGRFVLARACADAARFPAHLKVAVNLSVAQFIEGDVVEDIRSALSRAGLRPERLVVEITESLLLTDSVASLDILQRLKALRINIAMDDFGTGYSSLSYLRKYAFDRIKIDRDFISAARHGGKDAAIIRTIAQLGEALGMTTIAEGVETEEDLDMVEKAGCVEGQGYLFSRPVPLDEVLKLIGADSAKGLRSGAMAAA